VPSRCPCSSAWPLGKERVVAKEVRMGWGGRSRCCSLPLPCRLSDACSAGQYIRVVGQLHPHVWLAGLQSWVSWVGSRTEVRGLTRTHTAGPCARPLRVEIPR
jgi:hypothetical protein